MAEMLGKRASAKKGAEKGAALVGRPTAIAGRPAPSGHALLAIAGGAGEGHGVGMSQAGALGYAQHGYDYQAILAHYYSGTAIGQVPAKTRVRVMMGGKVRKLPIETYVRGVVSAEMSPQWPLAALEAQAVASRTYALTAHAGEGKFDVYADTRSARCTAARRRKRRRATVRCKQPRARS